MKLFINIFEQQVTQRYDGADASLEILILMLVAAILGFAIGFFVRKPKKEFIFEHDEKEVEFAKSISNDTKINTENKNGFTEKESIENNHSLEAENAKSIIDETKIEIASQTNPQNEVNASLDKLEVSSENKLQAESNLNTPNIDINLPESIIEANTNVHNNDQAEKDLNVIKKDIQSDFSVNNSPNLEIDHPEVDLKISEDLEKNTENTIQTEKGAKKTRKSKTTISKENEIALTPVKKPRKKKETIPNEKNNLVDENSSIINYSNEKKTTAKRTKNTAKKEIRNDDLKIIEGIGPAIEKHLNSNGITTFLELSETSVDRLQEILDLAGSRFVVHSPASWPMQATVYLSGDMDAFKKLTKELKGGRFVN